MKLSHKSARILLNKAQDGDLSSNDQIGLESHLKICAECQKYADALAAFDTHLGKNLSSLWPVSPASFNELTRMTAVVSQDQRSFQRRQSLWQGVQMAFKLSFAIITFVSLFFFFRSQNQPVESTAVTSVPTVNDASAGGDSPSPYIVVHYDFVISGGLGSAQFTHPVCDGVAYTPQTDALLQKLAEGQGPPECELVASNTLLFLPGETREVLLVFRNYQPEAVNFSFTPVAELGDGQPFASALCGDGRPFPSGRPNCQQYQVSGNGVWAKFFTVTAPESIPPDTNFNISINVKNSN